MISNLSREMMMLDNWVESSLGEVINFDPKEKIEKKQLAKKIAMDKLQPFSRKISGFEVSEYKGGKKFRNGDTLLARITPCLENGKTAQVSILEDNEVGFGSTEYIVLRNKKNTTDKDFIFYLAISPCFRDIAIKSMIGTSGRQRVQHDVLENLKINLPPLEEQKAIAATLSCLDDKIELNNRMNQTLEEMAQAIFKSWFVDFEPFQDGEFMDSELGRIPKGWRVVALGDLIKIIDNRGKTPPLTNITFDFPIIDVRALSGELRIINYDRCKKFVDENIYNNWFRSGHPKIYDILMSTVGSLAELKLFYNQKGCIAQNVVALRSIEISPLYLYQYLKNIRENLVSYNIGSVQPSIKVTHIIKHKILLPDYKILNDYQDIVCDITKKIYDNTDESQKLKELRNTLLPKLMSGEIRVPIPEVE
jgi:type I restriction enzyme S subunit